MVARIDTRLGQILRSEGRSQSWLSRTTGVGRPQINRYVHGIHDPELRIKEAIAEALKRTVEDVFPSNGAADMASEVSITPTSSDEDERTAA